MQDVEFAVVALAGDPAEPLELVPAQRVKPLVTGSVLQQQNVVFCKAHAEALFYYQSINVIV